MPKRPLGLAKSTTRSRASCSASPWRSAMDDPLGKQAIALGEAVGTFVFAEVDVEAVDHDDGLTRWLVMQSTAARFSRSRTSTRNSRSVLMTGPTRCGAAGGAQLRRYWLKEIDAEFRPATLHRRTRAVRVQSSAAARPSSCGTARSVETAQLPESCQTSLGCRGKLGVDGRTAHREQAPPVGLEPTSAPI